MTSTITSVDDEMPVYGEMPRYVIKDCTTVDYQFLDVDAHGSSISDPIADSGVVIKVEPDDDGGMLNEEGLLYGGDPDDNTPDSFSVTQMCPVCKATTVSSNINSPSLSSTKSAPNVFNPRFIDQEGDN